LPKVKWLHSEYQTSLVFRWSKYFGLGNGLILTATKKATRLHWYSDL
jgi:hypothetical protein